MAKEKRKFWLAGRQLGKSFAAAGLLVYKALSRKNGLSLCISTGSRAANEIIRKCGQFAEAVKLLSNNQIDYTQSFDSIKFANGSRVLSLPSSTDGSNLRGWSANCVAPETCVTVRYPSGSIIQMSLLSLELCLMKHSCKYLPDPYFGSSTELKKDVEKYGGENSNVYSQTIHIPGLLQVKTKNGWNNILSLNKTIKTQTIKLVSETHFLVCSRNHKIKTATGKWILAKNALHKIISMQGKNEEIVKIESMPDSQLMDLTVDGDHTYMTNGIESHNCVVVDECCFVSHFDQILNAISPTLTRDKDAELVLISTPAGKNSYAYKIFQEAIDNKQWYVQMTTIHDAVKDGLKVDLDSLHTLCPDPDVFAQEYECKWLSEHSSFIDLSFIQTYDELPKTATTYMGMDIGSTSDRTAIVTIYQDKDIYYVDDATILHKTSYEDQLNMLKVLYAKYKWTAGFIDQNGIGSAVAEFATKQVTTKIKGFVWTGSNKTPAYEYLRSLCMDHKIKFKSSLAKLFECDFQNIDKIVSEDGKVKYVAGRDGNGHSDATSALVLGLQAAKQNPANFVMPMPWTFNSRF